MGMFFSNLHIRKTDTLQQKGIRDYFVQMMKKKGYELVSSQEEAEESGFGDKFDSEDYDL